LEDGYEVFGMFPSNIFDSKIIYNSENKKGCSSGTEMELAKMTVSSSVGPLLHLFLCLVSESSSTDQGEALDALLFPLQGQQGSLERSGGLVVCVMIDYDPRGGTKARSHKRVIRRGSLIAYMCDRIFVRLD
jgi:hypothetical protein